jgi:ectoine hydroxylase-related dioxygenase (phytanoyl-CoA dioxygenase family)
MPNVLTEAQLEAYRRDGYLAPLRALPATDAGRYRALIEDHERRTGAPLQGKWRVKSHLLFTWADRIVHHPAILDAVEDVIGPDILCWTSNFFIKEPGTADFVSWHQDAAYWGLEPAEVVTAWVALTPSNLASGCVKVIPATHGGTALPHVDTFARGNMLTRGQEIDVEVDESRAVSLLLQPGEMSLHHIKLVHGSAPNRSRDRRIGLAIRYLPTHVRQSRLRDSAMLVRGTDAHRHFDLEPRPLADLDAAAMRAHADAVRRKEALLYEGSSRKPGA